MPSEKSSSFLEWKWLDSIHSSTTNSLQHTYDYINIVMLDSDDTKSVESANKRGKILERLRSAKLKQKIGNGAYMDLIGRNAS